LSSVTENLKFLQPDQIRSLNYNRSSKNKGITWSTATLKSAFELRYSCGVEGYNVLCWTGYPLPSYRTLSSHSACYICSRNSVWHLSVDHN